jgi:hypothetical protein
MPLRYNFHVFVFSLIFLFCHAGVYAWTGKVSEVYEPAQVSSVTSANLSSVMSVSTAAPTIVAVEYLNNGKVYTSTDGGTNWTTATISGMTAGNSGFGVGVAKDTGYIVMTPLGAGSDGVWFSKDNGATFTENTTYVATYKIGVFAPTTGGKIYVAGGNGANIIYTSDGGTTVASWTGLDNEVYDVAASKDGVYIVRIIAKPSVVSAKYSTNSGSSFSASSGYPAGGLYSVSMSADGAYIYTGTWQSTSHIYRSTDYGATFATLNYTDAVTANTWVRTNSTGQYVLMCVNSGAASGKTLVNNNYGNSANWTEVITGTTADYCPGGNNVSRSGKYMAVGDLTNVGTYYYSSDYGVTWSTRTIAGVTQKLRGIAIAD